MRFLSRLRSKLACWLSPQETSTFQQASQLKSLLEQQQWEKLCSALCTLLSSEQNFINNTVLCQDLKRQIAEAELVKAKAESAIYLRGLMPHSYLGVTLKHDGISWVSIYGYDESSIVGRGDCPFAALMDFDSQWLGTKQ